MTQFINLAGTLLAVFLLLQFVRLFVGTIRIIKMPLWAPLPTAVSRSELGELTPVFDAARELLERAGYSYIGTRRERSLVAVAGLPPNYADVYHHATHNVYAETIVADAPVSGRPFIVTLKSYLTDATVLTTTNSALRSWQPSTTRLHECETGDIAAMGATHLDQRALLGVACRPSHDAAHPTVDFATAIASEVAAAMLPAMVIEGMVYRRGSVDGEAVFAFRVLPAFKAAWAAQRRYDKLRKKSAAAAKTAQPMEMGLLRALAAAQRISLVRTIATLSGLSAPRWLQGASLALSVPAFIAVGAWFWGLQSTLAIGAVIALHEGGHWLAMKIAGFREVQVFFVPGFGGATVGEKHEARPLTHLFVYLAGPVPGLLAVSALFAYTVANPALMDSPIYPALSAGASAALFINLFNLLPVMPLDGGRVVDLFLFARLPWLRFAFSVASAILIFTCGWRYSLTSMEILGALMLVASKGQFRLAKASNAFRKQMPSPSGAERSQAAAVQDIANFLCQPRFQTWNFGVKLSLASAILPRFLGGTPRWRTSLAGLAIYIAATALPLALIGLAAHAFPTQARSALWHFGIGSTSSPRRAPAQAQDVLTDVRSKRAAVLASATPERRMQALKEAIADAQDYEDQEDALRLSRLYFRESAALPPPSREHADAILTLVMSSDLDAHEGNPDFSMRTSVEMLKEAEQIERSRVHKEQSKDDQMELAAILNEQSMMDGDSATVAIQQEIVDLYQSTVPANDARLNYARSQLARALDRAGQAEAAESQLRANLSAIEPTARGSELHTMVVWQADAQLASLLVEHNKLDEAKQLVNAAIPTLRNKWETARALKILWLIAHKQSDWAEAKRQAEALFATKGIGVAATDGNWLSRLLSSRPEVPRDKTSILMLIEATRKLGDDRAANLLVKQLRDEDARLVQQSQQTLLCRFRDDEVAGTVTEFKRVLDEIERREFECAAPTQHVN